MSEASWTTNGQALALARMNFFFQSTSLVSQVILVYDYFCTLDQEIELIWSKPVSFGSFLFLVNRYLPAVDTILMNTIFELKYATFASDECKSFIQSIAWLMFAGVAVSEFLLTIRTAAMWHRNPAMQLIFGCLVIIFLAPAILFMYMEMSSLEFAPAGTNFGCIPIKSKNTIYIVFSILALYEFVIAMFTAIKAYQHVRSTNSSWVLQLYTEGLLFYAYMLAFSIINAVCAGKMSAFGPPLECLQRVIHSIFCNRVLFAIFRGPSSAASERTENPTFTSLDENRLGLSIYIPNSTTTLAESSCPLSETSDTLSPTTLIFEA